MTLSETQMPNHSHTLVADDNDGDSTDPQDGYIGGGNQLFRSIPSVKEMAPESLPSAGGGQAHNNVHPVLTLNFIIALQGIFPSRN